MFNLKWLLSLAIKNGKHKHECMDMIHRAYSRGLVTLTEYSHYTMLINNYWRGRGMS